MKIERFTPILLVDAIEPELQLWRDRLGYEVTAEVPHGEKLGFVILKHGPSEVMLQTRASVSADLPALEKSLKVPATFLYADVASLDEVLAKLEDEEIVVPRRKTFYGADEVWIRNRAGFVIGFAQHA
jgi:hypothetical protein